MWRSRRWLTTCSRLSGESDSWPGRVAPALTRASPLAPRARSDFCALPPGARARLVDSLCSNLSVLGSSCGMLDAAVDGAALGAHRSALKTYAFFLTHIVLASEAEAREAAPVAATKVRTLGQTGRPLFAPSRAAHAAGRRFLAPRRRTAPRHCRRASMPALKPLPRAPGQGRQEGVQSCRWRVGLGVPARAHRAPASCRAGRQPAGAVARPAG